MGTVDLLVADVSASTAAGISLASKASDDLTTLTISSTLNAGTWRLTLKISSERDRRGEVIDCEGMIKVQRA